MRFSPLTERIAGRGVGTWETHIQARRLIESGVDVILLTVGNPDQMPAGTMIDATIVRAHQHSAGARKKGGKTTP